MHDKLVGVLPRNSTSSTDYWIIQVIQAFDSQVVSKDQAWNRSGDNDPDAAESATLGKALGHVAVWPAMDAKQTKCAIFHETIRDFRAEELAAWTQAGTLLSLAEVVDRVTAHELGHTMGLPHKAGTLMSGALDATANGRAIDDQQRRALTSRGDVHWVVTEHGAVNLFGRNLRERAELLISIAAPRFRQQLEAAAKKRKLLP